MFKKIKSILGQKGFTLVELLVSIALSGIIGVAIVTITFQTLAVNSADSNQIDAVKQVENALHWINRDAQMAYPNSIQPTGGDFSPSSPLNLTWTDTTENGDVYEVTYVVNNGELQRRQSINAGTETVTHISSNIDADSTKTNYSFVGQVLTINLTATVEGFRSASETRTLQVKPRIDPSPTSSP